MYTMTVLQGHLNVHSQNTFNIEDDSKFGELNTAFFFSLYLHEIPRLFIYKKLFWFCFSGHVAVCFAGQSLEELYELPNHAVFFKVNGDI